MPSPSTDLQLNREEHGNIRPPITTLASISSTENDPMNTGVAKHIDDFKFIKPISRGTYGKVFLGYRKDKPEVLYAIKAIKKEDVVRKNMVNSVHIERKAFCLSAADPFCVRLFYSLQTPTTVYLVMEYMIGGDLKSLLSIMGFFDVPAAAFYTAEISLALDFIHKCGVVHRDIKPDNVLIDGRGHVKLTDFGLSRVSMESDLTPRRMTNFTPGQIMSLKTEFCFPASSPDVSKSFENYKEKPENLRGNENSSMSMSCDMLTPTCSQEYSSVKVQNRRFRKPLRKLRNVENKAAVVPMQSMDKFSPELPKYDMNDWSIIQTPTEKLTKCVEYGSYLNVTFESPNPAKISPELVSPRAEFHHSSPVGPESSRNIPQPFISPLLPLETPYSSDAYSYDPEPVENPSKRHRSTASTGGSQKYKTAGESIGEGLPLTTTASLVVDTVESLNFKRDDPSHLACAVAPENSTAYEVTPNTGSLQISPEYVRRDYTQRTNYMNLIDNLNLTQAVPIKIPSDVNPSHNISISRSAKKVGSGSFKRKRWISSSSRSRTGISMHMRKLAIGSVNNAGSSGASSVYDQAMSSGEKNKSPPNGSGARIIGTPDYLAPEIIAKQTHGPAADWWSLGVCLYEFVVGCLPFSGESLNTIFHNIQTRDLEFPPETDPAVQSCIESLLDLEPEKRPSLSRLRSSEFHKFFGDLPWDNMTQAQPPFVPSPSSPTDTGYFNPRNVDQNIKVSEIINL